MTAHFVDLLDALQRRSLRMASLVEDILQEACEAVFDHNDALCRRVVSRDEDVDREEVAVETEVIRLLALYQPVGSDLRLLCTILKVNNDLERIADCAVNIAERAKHLDFGAGSVDRNNLAQMTPIVRHMLRFAVQTFGSRTASEAEKFFQEEEAVDAYYQQVIRKIVADAVQAPANMASYLDVLSIAKNLERIADHATNIVEDVMFLATGEIVRHRRGPT